MYYTWILFCVAVHVEVQTILVASSGHLRPPRGADVVSDNRGLRRTFAYPSPLIPMHHQSERETKGMSMLWVEGHSSCAACSVTKTTQLSRTSS